MSKLITPEAQDKLRGNERARHFKLAALALAVTGALALPAWGAEPADDLYHQVQRQVAAPASAADISTPRSILEREALFTPPNLDELVSLENLPSTQTREYYDVREPQSIGQDVTIQRLGTFRIPNPDPSIDYSSDPGRPLHGNAIYALEPLDPNKPYAQVKAEKTENPLASPYYNVATGQIDYPEEVLRQKQLDAYVSPEEERATRLKDYDKERVAQLKDANQYVPFDGLVQHDAVYSYLPEDAQVFYIDREVDRARLEEDITQIEKRSHGTLGFVLLDQNGIVALKDNSAYPLVGLSKFHLAYAVASLMSDRLENQNTRVFFFTDMLRSDVYSPLADILYKKATRIVRDATGKAILDPNSLENQPTASERSAIIASTVRQYQAGEDISVDLDEVRLHSITKQAVEDAYRTLPKGERLSLSIGDLMIMFSRAIARASYFLTIAKMTRIHESRNATTAQSSTAPIRRNPLLKNTVSMIEGVYRQYIPRNKEYGKSATNAPRMYFPISPLLKNRRQAAAQNCLPCSDRNHTQPQSF